MGVVFNPLTGNFDFTGSAIPAGSSGHIQLNTSNAFDSDADFTYTKSTDTLNVKAINLVPQATRWLTVNAPLAQASPVIEVKSNGVQVAYISDLGNCLFQNVGIYGGLSMNSGINPGLDNTYDVGSMASAFANVWTENVAFHSALNRGGSSQFHFDTPGMVMGVDLDMNGFNILNYTPPNPFNQNLNTSDTATFNAVYAGNFVASSDVSANSITSTNGISNSSSSIAISCAAGGQVIIGGSTIDMIRFIAGDAGNTPSNPGVTAGYITAILSNGSTVIQIPYET